MVKNQTLADLIRVIKFKSGITQSDIAAKIGVSKQYLSDTINGRYPFSDDLKQKLYEQFTYLQNGDGNGDMLNKEDAPQPRQEDTIELPLIPINAMAGVLSGNSQSFMEYDCEKYIVPAFGGADFLIRVQGDSMTPTYTSGDIIACQRVPLDRIWFQWGKVYVIDTRQGALVKRIEPSETEGCISIHSDNPKYKPFDLPTEEVSGVALVKGLIRVE